MTYDYIIAGAGAAGCVLANRLGVGQTFGAAAGSGWQGQLAVVQDPGRLRQNVLQPDLQLDVLQPAAEAVGQSEIYAPRGKVQGGSGSINAMIYVRGQAHDFDDWAANGNDGWGFKDVLPYFRKLENHPLGDSEYHGGSGPISITPMAGQTHPICDVFLKGCDELGYPRSDDFNGPKFEGAGIYDVNTKTVSAAPAASPICTRH